MAERGVGGTRRDALAKRVLLFAFATVMLLWPAAINRSPLLFPDSIGYLNEGQHAFEVGATTVAGSPQKSGGAPHGKSGKKANFLHSFGYPAFVYGAALTPIGAFGPLLFQTAIVLGMIALVARPAASGRARSLPVTIAPCAIVSSLPWFCSFLMPDVLAAVVILLGMLIVREDHRFGWAARGVALISASFACFTHYGHIPLQLGVSLTALLLLLLQRRLKPWQVFLGLAPVGLALVANLAVSSVAFDEPSVAPKRLPLLLARSIEDGPARWHLQTHCAEYRYTICKFYSRVPDNLAALLWDPKTSLPSRATHEQMEQIRREEPLILRRAFLEYPLQQSWSFSRNAATQLLSIGAGDFQWARLKRNEAGSASQLADVEHGRTGLDEIGAAQIVFVIASVLLIAVFAWTDGLRAGEREREMLLVLVVGLVLNAVIFGGLSAPVDRYQARVIWLLPLFATMCCLTRGVTLTPKRGFIRSKLRTIPQRGCPADS